MRRPMNNRLPFVAPDRTYDRHDVSIDALSELMPRWFHRRRFPVNDTMNAFIDDRQRHSYQWLQWRFTGLQCFHVVLTSVET